MNGIIDLVSKRYWAIKEVYLGNITSIIERHIAGEKLTREEIEAAAKAAADAAAAQAAADAAAAQAAADAAAKAAAKAAADKAEADRLAAEDAARAASDKTKADAAAAAAVLVAMNAETAISLAPKALPALNPNQPNHRSAAPIRHKGRLWGGIGSWPYPLLLPI